MKVAGTYLLQIALATFVHNMKTLPNSDWLRAVQLYRNTVGENKFSAM